MIEAPSLLVDAAKSTYSSEEEDNSIVEGNERNQHTKKRNTILEVAWKKSRTTVLLPIEKRRFWFQISLLFLAVFSFILFLHLAGGLHFVVLQFSFLNCPLSRLLKLYSNTDVLVITAYSISVMSNTNIFYSQRSFGCSYPSPSTLRFSFGRQRPHQSPST